MTISDTLDLQDQTALVTGATSGLGRSIALQLARQGAEVIVHGRNPARGAETVDAITAAGGRGPSPPSGARRGTSERRCPPCELPGSVHCAGTIKRPRWAPGRGSRE